MQPRARLGGVPASMSFWRSGATHTNFRATGPNGAGSGSTSAAHAAAEMRV